MLALDCVPIAYHLVSAHAWSARSACRRAASQPLRYSLTPGTKLIPPLMSLPSLDRAVGLLLYEAGSSRGLAVDTAPIPCKLSAQILIVTLNQTNQNFFACDAVVKMRLVSFWFPVHVSAPQLTLVSTLAGYESSRARV